MSKRKSDKQDGPREKVGKTVSFREEERHHPKESVHNNRMEEDTRAYNKEDDDSLNVPEGEEERFDEREDFSGGYKLEAFNMYDEREEGQFTEAGSYQERGYTKRREDNNKAFLKGEKIKKNKTCSRRR